MDGFSKDWPIVKRLLVANHLEHAAMLASGLKMSEEVFVRQARVEYQRLTHRIATVVQLREEALNDLAAAIASDVSGKTEAVSGGDEGEDEKPAKESQASSVLDDGVAGEGPKKQADDKKDDGE